MQQPPIWQADGSVVLWHPESPGVRVVIGKATWLRRTVLRRQPFATFGEMRRHYREWANR